jgi:hypothetical protein
MRTLLLLALLLPAPAVAAADASPPETRGAYVTVNVGIEMHALEQAAADTARATEELAAAVRDMAASPTLSEENRAQLMAVIGRVDDLSSRVIGAVERMPAAVRESREPLVAIAEDLASQVRWTIAGFAVLLLAMALGALGGFYVFVLRPGRHLTATIAGGAQTLLRTLEHVAEIAGANAALLTRSLETPNPAPPAATVTPARADTPIAASSAVKP